MNSTIFKDWFIQMMKRLEEPSIIVMDNVSYHSTTSENYPKSNTKKFDVQQWLTNKGIDFSPLETLCELRERVKYVTPREKNYELDEIALQMGHSVVRLPPYHCQYNPIELIWAQIKNKVAELNTTFKIVDVEKLVNEVIDSVTVKDW
jgi:transposase